MIDVAEEELVVPIRKSLGLLKQSRRMIASPQKKRALSGFCELFGYSKLQAGHDHGWHFDDCRMREDEIVELVKNQRRMVGSVRTL
ncbi:MAG: hypothetical protein IPN95_23125 [Bacteroidetes bacterium]|nr:hypothetical protein [Bacteroidota bacterium]